MPTVETTPVSRSGITTSSTGERHIPSSTRADGSVRKEIKVRPGYRPPEDVELYKNRTAEGFRNKGKGGVPGAEGLNDITKLSPAANKNAKRREARKKAASTATPAEGKNEAVDAPVDEAAKKVERAEPVESVDPEVAKKKEAKKLLKKLRQAKELKDKEEKGDKLLPEQFAKVIKINELMRQLKNLGFDEQGEKSNP